jgi:2-phospho-L-lactate guanylyltransferase (CobY/MobA/RfbA family)
MFKWIKNLFVTAEDVATPVQEVPVIVPTTPAVITAKKPEVAVSKKAVKELDTTTNWPFPTVRPEEKVAVEKVTKASLSKLTKQGLEDFALATYGVDIDRRKKKEELVKEVLKLSKKA